MSEVKSLSVGSAGLVVGAGAGFILSPQLGTEILHWVTANLKVTEIIALLTAAVSLVVNWLLWIRLKEKDLECQQEIELTRKRWSEVITKLEDAAERRQVESRADRNEMAKTVAELTTQVTLLVDRCSRTV